MKGESWHRVRPVVGRVLADVRRVLAGWLAEWCDGGPLMSNRGCVRVWRAGKGRRNEGGTRQAGPGGGGAVRVGWDRARAGERSERYMQGGVGGGQR